MGAFLFRVGPSNKPAEIKGFFDRQPKLDDLLEHLERRGRLGIEPQSINTVAVDVDYGNSDRFFHNFPPFSMYKSKTEGRCHAYFRHDGARVRSKPFCAPLFRISGDLKHARSYVVLYNAPRLAEDLSNGSLGVPFAEVERALVTAPLAAQGGQRGPLTTPVGSEHVSDDSTPSPGYQRHNWILGKLIAARADGVCGHALRRYAVELHGGLVQPPDDVPHYFPRSEALSIADFVSTRSYSVEHQRAAGVSSGVFRRARSAERDTRILDLLGKGLSIRRIAKDIEVSRRTVARVKDRRRG